MIGWFWKSKCDSRKKDDGGVEEGRDRYASRTQSASLYICDKGHKPCWLLAKTCLVTALSTYTVIEQHHWTKICKSPRTAPKAFRPFRVPLSICFITGREAVGQA